MGATPSDTTRGFYACKDKNVGVCNFMLFLKPKYIVTPTF
jgi:hypothetical protein